MQIKKLSLVLLFCLLVAAIVFLFPWLFKQVVVWQRDFNELLSSLLHQVNQDPIYAGSSLILISFLYGVFHALGPGHGKLTFLSSLMQGVVAVSATSVVVVALNLSSAYFSMSQLWLERGAFGLILLLGVQWCYQSLKKLYRQQNQPAMPEIQRAKFVSASSTIGQSAVKNIAVFQHHQHDEHCGCGHQHIPAQEQLERANDLKSQILVILSIGMRPCTGAIFVLFLAYMLDLYYWGILATMAMSLGTGMMLSGFALLVLYARQTAVKVGKWYLSPKLKMNFSALVKLIFGILLIGFSATLIYSTTLPTTGGAVLFGN